MKKSHLSVRERQLAIATVSVIGLVFGFQFGIEPLFARIEQLQKDVARELLRLEKYDRLIAQRRRIEEQFIPLAARMAIRRSEEEEMADFLTGVERIGADAALVVKGLRPRPINAEGEFRNFIIEVNAEGTIEQVARFLYELQEFSYPVKVERMQLAVKKSASELLEARWTLSSLRFKSVE